MSLKICGQTGGVENGRESYLPGSQQHWTHDSSIGGEKEGTDSRTISEVELIGPEELF